MGKYLIGISSLHGFYRHANKLGRDSFAAVCFFSSQHGNITSQRTSAMRLELTNHDSDESVGFIESLKTLSAYIICTNCL